MQPTLPVGSNTQNQAGVLSLTLRLALGEALGLSQGGEIVASEDRIYTRAYLLGGALGLTERLGLSGSLSVLDVNFVAQEQRTRGLGASALFVHWAVVRPTARGAGFTANLGVTPPGGGVPQPDIPAASVSVGSYDPSVSLAGRVPLGPVLVLGEALARPTLIPVGEFGRTPGPLARASLGLRANDPRGFVETRGEFLWRGPDRGPRGLEENTGGAWVYLVESVQIAPPALYGLACLAEVRVPLAQQLNGAQLADGISGLVGLSYQVPLFGEARRNRPAEEADEHHAGDGHHHEGAPEKAPDQARAALDVAVAIEDGRFVDPSTLAVPGKVTLVHYGAEWCHPCHDLREQMLDFMTKERPDIALREVDIVDWDAPMATRYLSRLTDRIPYVEVYDAQGRLVRGVISDAVRLQETVRALPAR